MSTLKPDPNNNSTAHLRGVGPQVAKHLIRLDIHSIPDLLFHLPARYQDRTTIQPMRGLVVGEEVVIEGVIKAVSMPLNGRTKLLCELQDDTGRVFLRFFKVLSFQVKILIAGARLRCYGQVRLGQKGLEMTHPEFQLLSDEKFSPVESHLTPVYPATEGLGQYTLRKLTTNALSWMKRSPAFKELLPVSLLEKLVMPDLQSALQFVHRPPSDTSLEALEDNKTISQKRLIFEELLAHRLSLLHGKKQFHSQQALPLKDIGNLSQVFLQQLPFALTKAQLRVVNDITADIAQSSPMLRLLQGDVGSGKTVVAALTMLRAVENHAQAALMAPTELLAEQHYRVFKKWLEPLGLQVVLLTGSTKASARKLILAAIENGEAQIVLGTHALFQAQVIFKKLALVIMDEQHRFGVHQRALFREKGVDAIHHPHQLIMTATPIPRTLAMSFYADLDVSVIDELPPGRTPIVTTVLAATKREEMIERIRNACAEGRQVYWVCPLIEESEVLNCQAATTTSELLQEALPHLKVGLIHGRMSAAEKEATMQAFQQGETQLLVATTVIEVGVDVPNASVMIIENAERLGLAQLHQLRGRVGRGTVASYCVLLYQYPLSNIAKERLNVMRETTDGFKIAQRDLELRGPGEVLGTRQTGDLCFHVADLLRDSEMLPSIQIAAEHIMQEHQHIMQPLIKRWLGDSAEYAKV